MGKKCKHFPRALKKQMLLSWPEIYFIVKHNKKSKPNFNRFQSNQIQLVSICTNGKTRRGVP